MIKPLLAAALGQKPSHTPLWLMRQAGRYLPEYMEIRAKHDTLTMFKTPKIAAEITLQPLHRFPLDAAILYADILLIPEALNLGLKFVKGEGPQFERTIRTQEDLDWLKKQAENPDAVIARTSYIAETLQLVKPQLPAQTALIGFAGAPWTVASYMIEGGSAHGEFFQSKLLMFQSPHILHGILDILTDLTIRYLNIQVDAGAEILQLFESWGGALTPDQYIEFCAPYSEKIMKALQKRVPVIHFVGQSAGILSEAMSVSADMFGVDWRQNLQTAADKASALKKGIQGNLDPLLLYAPQKLLEQKTLEILRVGTAHPNGFIFNLGHGIRLTTPPENVKFLCDLVHSYK